MKPRTCVSPSGKFVYGIHKPSFAVANLRENDFVGTIGRFPDGGVHENRANFPTDDVEEPGADTIFEIPNPFAFRGTTYIAKSWADEKAGKPELIKLPKPEGFSFANVVEKWFGNTPLPNAKKKELFESLPDPLLIAVASSSTDPEDLTILANLCCEFVFENDEIAPVGMAYEKNQRGAARPVVKNHDVFETLVNNHYLPYEYKKAMVLFPGVQGNSEIVGEYNEKRAHVFEYLRRNSYIPWGHYAANMAHDSVRYGIDDLSSKDMEGLRHLYYQRTYVRLARQVGIGIGENRRRLSKDRLEKLRREIQERIADRAENGKLPFNCTLWGWNFGFDFSHSKYRLHASHQQIHQQFALIPSSADSQEPGKEIPSFACGDMVAEFVADYKKETGKSFFESYFKAIRGNRRMDGIDEESSLVIREDENAMLFVPKAQTSQWEIQLVTVPPVGNILEADSETRESLDKAMLTAVKILWDMGARMITIIEYAKRIDDFDSDQRLVYAFLPKIPQSMGAFSEAQLRWINGHYPEDFASACRLQINSPRK